MKPEVFPKWLDQYPIVDEAHKAGLEMGASIHEIMHKLPRHEAEAAAHEEYRKDQIAEAAAHHLSGMKAAHAVGAMDEARKHGVLYALALKQLGHEPAGEIPPEVSTKAKNMAATKPIHKFKSHKGDAFSLPDVPEEDVKKSELRKDDVLQMPGAAPVLPTQPMRKPTGKKVVDLSKVKNQRILQEDRAARAAMEARRFDPQDPDAYDYNDHAPDENHGLTIMHNHPATGRDMFEAHYFVGNQPVANLLVGPHHGSAGSMAFEHPPHNHAMGDAMLRAMKTHLEAHGYQLPPTLGHEARAHSTDDTGQTVTSPVMTTPSANDNKTPGPVAPPASARPKLGLVKDEVTQQQPARRLPPPPPVPKAQIPLAQRRYGDSNHFNYDDHLPTHSKAGGFGNITVSQQGKTVHANLGQHGAVVAYQGPAGDYSIIHDTLKEHARGSVRMQHPHVLAALKNHISQMHQAPFVPATTAAVTPSR